MTDNQFTAILVLSVIDRSLTTSEAALRVLGKLSEHDTEDFHRRIKEWRGEIGDLVKHREKPLKIYRAIITQELLIAAKDRMDAERALNASDWGDPPKDLSFKDILSVKSLKEDEADSIPLSLEHGDERTCRQILELREPGNG